MSKVIRNEFSVRFANVNGSGSASANGLFARSLYRLGLPVSVKNIFPSNIQGAPTWYEVRVSESGYLARTSHPELMVAMNPQTYEKDVQDMASKGVLLYDSSFERDFQREDIRVLGAPLMRLCLDAFGNIKERHMFRNIAGCGVLGSLLGVPLEIYQTLLAETFAGKERLIEPNVQALKIGFDWAEAQSGSADFAAFPFRAEASDALGDRIMITGNDAAGLGCVYGGATVAAWYPLTPSTSLAEAFTKYGNSFRKDDDGRKRLAIVQAEDELAAAGMVLGAGWNGARAFTATSGPGISLMSEFIGLAYMAEVPMVLFDVQRGGPSTGMPTRTQQSDILSCAYASHGDTLHPLLFPSDPKECFGMAAQAFDLADRLQTPVFVMTDLDLGMNEWVCEPFEWNDKQEWDRGKIMTAEALDDTPEWGRYVDVDGDGVPWRTLPGTHPQKGAYLARGTSHDEYGRYTEDGEVHARVLGRIAHKWETAKGLMPAAELSSPKPKHSVALVYYGTTAIAVPEAMEMLGKESGKIDLACLRSFPFSDDLIKWLAAHDKIIVAEQNRDGQMRKLLISEGGLDGDKLVSLLLFDGMPITAAAICQELRPQLARKRSAAA